jgi:hypothetical protein
MKANRTARLVCLMLCTASVAQFAAADPAQSLPPSAQIGNYSGEDVMIPMRDGVKLHAEVWRPRDAAHPLPILLQRTPYGVGLVNAQKFFGGELKELAQAGFIFVLEDIRGRFGSEGDFVMLRPRAPAGGVDESTDAYDTIDWLVKNVSDNNGAVGMFGVSYMGWTTAMATIDAHPALKAVSIQASPEDMFLGDDFHHNGAFRLQYAWEYVAALEADTRTSTPFSYGKDDAYAWLLKQDHLATLDQRTFGRSLPSWRAFVAHPNYDASWRSQVTSVLMPKQVGVPDLIVAGWWDQEDFYGPLTIYNREKKGDAHARNFIVIGPWNHGGWADEHANHYGPFDLGSDTATYFRKVAEVPWFTYWLKHEGTLTLPRALVFETGSNRWMAYDAWPPATGVIHRDLYMHAGGVLSFDPPNGAADSTPDKFLSDPAHPVPYRVLPVASIMTDDSSWSRWLADDQAPFAKRPDVLFWETEPLQHEVIIRGDAVAHLFASTTGSDADWVVKLIDVYPTGKIDSGGRPIPADLRGRQLIIADEVFRGRFHESFEHPHAITPGEVLGNSIDLHSASHDFKPGHRIAVQVQSTWFPLIDRNPQIFQASIFDASEADYRAQTHSVYHTREFPSAISVDLAE